MSTCGYFYFKRHLFYDQQTKNQNLSSKNFYRRKKGETESCCKRLNSDIPTTAILNDANLFYIDRTTKKVIILAVCSWSVKAFIIQDNSSNCYFVELL